MGPALEMLLGPNREALIVSDTDIEAAFQYLWSNRSRWHGCRIVNTRKIRNSHGRTRTLPPNSIAHVLRTDNPDARAFVDTQVGRYVCADTEHDLENHDHAVMRNGKTTSALALRVYSDVSPILGRTAQAAAVTAARDKLAILNRQLAEKENERKLLEAGISHLATFAAAGDIEARLRDASEAIRRADARLKALARDRESVGDARSQALREEIEVLEEQTKAYEGELAELREAERKETLAADSAAGRISERQETAAKAKLAERTIETEQTSERNAKLVVFAEAEELTIEKARTRLAVEAFQKRGEEKHYLAERRDRAKEAADGLLRAGKETGTRSLREFAEYVRQWLEGPSPLPDDADHADHCFWCATRENRLEEHELRPHRDRVRRSPARI